MANAFYGWPNASKRMSMNILQIQPKTHFSHQGMFIIFMRHRIILRICEAEGSYGEVMYIDLNTFPFVEDVNHTQEIDAPRI